MESVSRQCGFRSLYWNPCVIPESFFFGGWGGGVGVGALHTRTVFPRLAYRHDLGDLFKIYVLRSLLWGGFQSSVKLQSFLGNSYQE